MSTPCVLDASVIVALFIPEEFTDAAIQFADALSASGVDLFAPDALFYEVVGTLRRYEYRGLFATMDADLQRLMRFPFQVTPSRELAAIAARISREYVVSPYDAFYLALAAQLHVPLITADTRLVNAAQGKGFDVRHVTDMV